MAHGGAHDDHRLQLRAGGDNPGHGRFRIRQQAVLAEQVGAGIPCYAQFRENDHGRMLRGQVLTQLENLPDVRRRVGHVHARHRRRHTDESKMLHRRKDSGFAQGMQDAYKKDFIIKEV